MAERGVSLPVIPEWIRDYALHGHCGVFTRRHCSPTIISIGNRSCPAVRIEEYLCSIKSQTVGRIERTVHTITVKLARPHARNKEMPIVIGAVAAGIEADHPRGLRIVSKVKEQQLDGFRLTRENTEINSVVEDCCAQRGGGGFETTCHSTNRSAGNVGRERKKQQSRRRITTTG